MLELSEYTKIFLGLFAILDPIGAIPMLIAFTADADRQKRLRVAQLASLAVGGILLAVLLVGELALEFFGISIHSFRTAGGIVLLLMAVGMLFGNRLEVAGDGDATSSIAIVPLSTPLLAGPGAISAVIVDAHKGSGTGHYLVLSAEIVLLAFTVWLTFRIAPWLAQRLGKIGINVFTRLMGLLLAAIAVEFIAGGLRGLFPALG